MVLSPDFIFHRYSLTMNSMEKSRFFISDGLKIEALQESRSTRRGIVITHPHPLYGGDMYSPVVDTVRKVYRDRGYTTLRFNFRGTGKSGGKYDEGEGEQIDVFSAVEILRKDGVEEIDLAGYSFGAWVNAGAVASGLDVHQMVMISPPVAMIDFKDIGTLDHLRLVITGEHDDIAPPRQIKEMLAIWAPSSRLKVIGSADHFYTGHLAELAQGLFERCG